MWNPITEQSGLGLLQLNWEGFEGCDSTEEMSVVVCLLVVLFWTSVLECKKYCKTPWSHKQGLYYSANNTKLQMTQSYCAKKCVGENVRKWAGSQLSVNIDRGYFPEYINSRPIYVNSFVLLSSPFFSFSTRHVAHQEHENAELWMIWR